jgi:hypothetical protein
LYNIAINTFKEFGNPRIDSLKKDIAFNLNILNDTIFEFKALNNIIVDAIKKSNNIIINIIGYKLKDLENVLNVFSKLIAINILSIIKLDLITLKFDIIDLNILKAKSKA